MRPSTRYFVLFYGAFETFVFSGCIFGWTALYHMLRHEGIYSHLCRGNATAATASFSVSGVLMTTFVGDIKGELHFGNGTVLEAYRVEDSAGSSDWVTCDEQDKVLNLAYTIGSFCLGISSVVWGYLLDKWGLRCVRLLINGCITSGTVLLSLTIKETSFLLFPSLTLLCLAGVPLRLANMQIANLFPNQRATIITTYSGAFTASASVFVFLKYGYQSGLPWEWACFILVCLSVAMLPVTLFLLPVDRVREPEPDPRPLFPLAAANDVAAVAPPVDGKYTATAESPSVKKKSEISTVAPSDTPKKSPPKEEEAREGKRQLPLSLSLLSVSYLMHQYWFCWILLYTIYYIGTLHVWIQRTSDDADQAEFMSETYGLVQISGLFLAPLGGIFMDWSTRKHCDETDPEKRELNTLRACFWPMFLTTGAEAVAQLCKYFNEELAIYASIVAVTLLRAFFVAIGTAYLRIRFPWYHFNRMVGIMSSMSAIFTLLQFPLFIWESKSLEGALQVNVFATLCLAIAFVHPLLLLATPLQKYFFRRKAAAEERFWAS